MAAAATQSAIVTGASGGIGRAVATRLAKDGFSVAVHYAGSAAKAQEVVAAIEAGGGRAIVVRADVADTKDLARLFNETLHALGKIYIVSKRAGIMTLTPI